MSIPTFPSPSTTTRPLSDNPMPAIFGNLIRIIQIQTTYVAGDYAPFSSPAGQSPPVVALFFTNLSTSDDIFVSFDGINDHIIIPPNSNNLPFNLLTNKRAAYRGLWARASTAGATLYISYIM